MGYSRRRLTILFIMDGPAGLEPLFWGTGKPEGMPGVYKLLQGLVDAGHEVHFLSGVDDAEMEGKLGEGRYLFTSGIHFYMLTPPHIGPLSALMRMKIPFLEFFMRVIHVKGLYRTIFRLGELMGFIRKIKPDIIYAGISYEFLGSLSGRLARIPTILRFYGVHNHYSLRGGSWTLERRRKVSLAFKLRSDCVIITNDGTWGDEFAKFYGVPDHKLKFWINGVDKTNYQPDFDRESFLKRLDISPQNRVVLTLCRLQGWKRVDRIIEAAPKVVEKVNNVVFLIVGDGPERTNLELLAQRLGVYSQVKFVGAIPHDEVPGVMNAADIFVSLHDLANLPNTTLEAMSCGKCIISLDDGSLDSVIENGKSGILIKPESAEEELPNALIDLLRDDEKRLQLGCRAREFALNKLETWDERINKEIRLIREIASIKR